MWLAIETAGDQASVALGSADRILGEASVTGARRHAAALLPLIQDALGQAAGSLADIEGVLIADGPGSFTGLRVGATVAKALVHVKRIPLWTASTLLVSAAGVARRAGEHVIAVSEALRGEVYVAAYRISPAEIETVLHPAVRRAEDLAAEFASADTVAVCGYEGLIRRLPRSAARLVAAPDALPRAAALLGLLGRAGAMTRRMDPGTWEPEYGRPAEAQARWEAAHGRRLPDPSRTA